MEISELLDAGYKASARVELKRPGLYLWGEFMHGDADAYTKEQWKMGSLEELEAIISYIDWIKANFTHNAEIDYRRSSYDKREKDFYHVVGEKWKKDYLWDGLLDWWPSDITYDGIQASLQGCWIVFVDSSGLEYLVEKGN